MYLVVYWVLYQLQLQCGLFYKVAYVTTLTHQNIGVAPD